MLKWLLVFTVIYFIYKSLNKNNSLNGGSQNRTDNSESYDDGTIDLLVNDPNCGKYIPKEKAIKIENHGEVYFFCSMKCAKEYIEKLDKQK